MTQRHVVPADIAEQMFPFSESYQYSDGSHSRIDQPPTVRWLVGPIDCAECDGSGNAQVYGRNSPPCLDCAGLGYPPTVEIVSEMEVHPGNEPYAVVHGVVKLGKPVPIVLNSNDWEHGNIDHIDLMPPHAFRRVPTDGFSEDVFAITDNIGPCKPGDVAYPIEVAS